MTRWTANLILLVWFAVASASAGAQGGSPPSGAGRPGPGGQRTPVRAAPSPAAETASTSTATLRGQVVASDTGAPIRRAQVRVSASTSRESRLATTDAQGRFEIRALPAGRYTLSASKGGFVTLQYGQRRPGESGTPLELAEGQQLDKLIVGLPRGSVLSGRVTDEFGEPVANAAVSALRYAYVGGARRLMPAGARDTTDDRGQYRLFGLPPGDYIVSAMLRTAEVTDPGDDAAGFAPTYYPGTANAAEAQPVRVALQQENATVSFGLMATRLVRLSGAVIGASGEPAWGGVVVLTSASGAPAVPAFRGGGGGGRIEGDGSFRLANVAPGRYQLQARTGGRTDAEFARMDIIVGPDDVEGLTLVTAPAGRVSGVVRTDTGAPLPVTPQPLQVSARPATVDGPAVGGGGGNQGRVDADGRFELGNLTDPRFLRVNTPQGWTLKAVVLNGQDITDVPIDAGPGQRITDVQVVITQKVSTVTGTVYDDRKQPVLDATVVIFPLDERLRGYQSRFIRAARPNQEGTFTVTAVPPGEYLAVALQALEDGQSGDPEFLASVEALGTRLTVEEGESETVTLTIAGQQ
jgi:hypothetical protein